MEDSVKDQSSASGTAGRSSAKLLRYPLRSATKAKEEKPPLTQSASASRRGKPESSLSKSVGVLDVSGKEKSAKPPRRMSIPSKSAASPASRSIGNITPISEARAKRSTSNQGRNDTPVSDVSKSSNRKKFSVLSSASYWLSQIKLSESAAKHSVSLGFFTLALEAGCEPLQRMRDELKSYARKHNLAELGEPVKELFEKYSILESFEQLQVSETCSHVPDEGTRSSDEDVHSFASLTESEQQKPKSSNTDAAAAKQIKESNKEITMKNDSVRKIRRPANKNAANLKSSPDAEDRNSRKKTQKPKQESNKNREKVKKPVKKSAHEEGSIDPLPVEETLEENKENMDTTPMVEEVVNSSEV